MDNHGVSSELATMFDQIDQIGLTSRTAQVSLNLYNNSMMTVRAGGPGIHSWPPTPPFSCYEVLISEYPPKFWHKYSDTIECMYDKVPRLLICDHIITAGGMYGLVLESQQRTRAGLMNLQIAVSETAEKQVLAAVEAIRGIRLIASSFQLQS